MWAFAKYCKKITSISYINLVLPTRWNRHQAALGAFYISKAKELIRSGNHTEAFTLLKIGTAKAPENLEGRLLLADFYMAYKRPDLAQSTVLENAATFAKYPGYFAAVVDLLFKLQDDRAVLTLAQTHLGTPLLSKETAHFLAVSSAHAAFNLGNNDEAEDILRRYVNDTSPDKAALLIRLDWERGYRDLALLQLREAIDRWPTRSDLRALLVSHYRATHNTSQWETALVEQISADPFAFEPRVEYIRMLHERGEHPRAASEIDTFISQFNSSDSAMLVLADFAANSGQPELVAKAGAHLTDNSDLSSAVSLLAVEANVVAGNFGKSLQMISEYTEKYPQWAAQYAPVFSGLKAVAACGLGKKEEAILYLDELFSQENIRADNLVAVSSRLAALGANDLSAETLRRAVKADPQNEIALNTLVSLELDAASAPDLGRHLEAFLATRKPSREIASKAYTVLGSDRHLFTPGQSQLLASLKKLSARKAN